MAGGCGDTERPEGLSRAQLFQGLIPHQGTAPQGHSLDFCHGWKFGKQNQPGGQTFMSLHTCNHSLMDGN